MICNFLPVKGVSLMLPTSIYAAGNYLLSYLPGMDGAAQRKELLLQKLFTCVESNDERTIQELFNDDGNFELITAALRESKNSPLHKAAELGKEAALGAMLEKLPADIVNIRDEHSRTLLMLASGNGHVDAVRTLLDIDERNTEKRREGMSEISYPTQALAASWVDAIKSLLGYLVNLSAPSNILSGIDAQDGHGYTAVNLAAASGHLDVVNALIDRGANINLAASSGKISPLISAVVGRYQDVVQVLCDAKADVKAVYGDTTALISAVDAGPDKDGRDLRATSINTDIIHLLIKAGAEVDKRGKSGYDALMTAVARGSLNAIKALIENGASSRVRTDYGRSLLSIAVDRGHADIVKYLLEVQNLPADDSCDGGHTPLFAAAFHGDLTVIDLLIDNGAKVDRPVSRNQDTALFYARDEETARKLISRGANVHALDLLGQNALMRATFKGYQGVAKVLREHGVDESVKSKLGYSVMSMKDASDEDSLREMYLEFLKPIPENIRQQLVGSKTHAT